MRTSKQSARGPHIEFDGFEEWPGLRRDLVAFINVFCAEMTLAQAREWFDEAFPSVPRT
jgi:hypothetical protein